MALARRRLVKRPELLLVVATCGAALFLGDAVITLAISVLSVDTLTILAVLFEVQRFGTGRVSSVFGPVTALWFLAIGLLD